MISGTISLLRQVSYILIFREGMRQSDYGRESE